MLVSARGAATGYDGRPVLTDLDLAVSEGERIGVLGPNGGGKSTLFKALLGDVPAANGSITGATRFGYVPQTERSRLDYPVTALDGGCWWVQDSQLARRWIGRLEGGARGRRRRRG